MRQPLKIRVIIVSASVFVIAAAGIYLVLTSGNKGGVGLTTRAAPSAIPAERWNELHPTPPGEVERLTYAPGQQVDLESGIFFMDTMTGVIDGWTIDDPTRQLLYGVAANNRFISAQNYRLAYEDGDCAGYLIDRRTAAAYTWNCHQQRLTGLWPRHLLFEEVTASRRQIGTSRGVPQFRVELIGTGRFTLLNEALASETNFNVPARANQYELLSGLSSEAANTVPATGPSGGATLLSPNEQRLALIASRSLYIVELANGSVAAPGEVPDVLGNNRPWISSLLTGSSGEIVLVAGYPHWVFQGAEPQTLIRRYSWSGGLLSELAVPGKNVQVSPDGRLIAWQGAVRYATGPSQCCGNRPIDWPTVVVADARTGEARFRVKGAALCNGDGAVSYTDSPGIRWLADSSGVVVATKSSYSLVSAQTGSLSPLWPYENSRWPAPSPDDPNLFAIGRVEVSDSSGTTRHRASLATSGFGPLDPWGAASRELRFAVPFPFFHGGGNCGIGVSGSPRVEFPPFDDALVLVVSGTNSCLNLRRLPSVTADVITCVPDGGQVAVTETTLKDVPNYVFPATASVFYSYPDGPWVHVRTTEGQEGWVAAQYLDWAE